MTKKYDQNRSLEKEVSGITNMSMVMDSLLSPQNLFGGTSVQLLHSSLDHNKYYTRSRTPSSSSNISENHSHRTNSKILMNPFNDTNSSQVKIANSPNKEDYLAKFQFSEFIKNNSSLSNSPSSFLPHHPVSNLFDVSTKPVKKSPNLQISSFIKSPSRGVNINQIIRPGINVQPLKSISIINNETILFNRLSSPTTLERQKLNQSKIISNSICSSPIIPKSASVEFEIDKAFLTSDNDYANLENLYPDFNSSGLNIRENCIGSESHLDWLGGIKNMDEPIIANSSQKSPIGESEEPLPSLKGIVKESYTGYDDSSLMNKHSDRGRKRKSTVNKKPKKLKKISKSTKIKKEPSSSKTISFDIADTIKMKPQSKVTKVSPKVIPSSEEPLLSLSSEDYKSDAESDAEYIPGKFRQTRSKRRLVKFIASDVELEKKRRLGLRSKSGCWTCRVRHKACPENKPKCGQCERLHLECDYSEERPMYMTNTSLQAAKLKEIRDITSQQKRINLARKRAGL